MHFVTADGKAVDLADFRGKVVLVIFFAAWSPPSITALQNVQKSVTALPRGRMQVLGVSLDDKPEALAATIKQNAVTWPVGYDGKGWEGPLARSLGINSLPTLWLFDPKGRLRSLNALEGIAGQGRNSWKSGLSLFVNSLFAIILVLPPRPRPRSGQHEVRFENENEYQGRGGEEGLH